MDCMEGMKEFPDGFFDLAIVDPPYGMNITGRHVVKDADGGALSTGSPDRSAAIRVRGGGDYPFGGVRKLRQGTAPDLAGGGYADESAGRALKVPSKFYHAFDDTQPPDEGYFEELQRVSKNRVIWGMNFLNDFLGTASCVIVWDKGRRGMSQADCELAWTDLPGQSRIVEFRWNGMLQGDMKNKEERIHPTQKPVKLYDWILEHYAKPGFKILDTHVGSASSLIACRRAGLEYWGFEIDTDYYAKAKERLDRECAQVNFTDLI